MRLSSRLSDKNKNSGEIEQFINWEKYTTIKEEDSDEVTFISAGDFIEIEIGTISLPFYSTVCNDSILCTSPERLHCLIVNNSMISIDCQLKCNGYKENNSKCRRCNPYVEAWFLVEVDDITAYYPKVSLVKQNFKLPQKIRLPIDPEDKLSECLVKAEIAYKERLGAGAIIYLRSAFELITRNVGHKAGVDVYNKKGVLKPFSQVLEAVDKQCSIIPTIYSDNGYALFKELSKIAHGDVDDETALEKYIPLRSLVVGIIENVKKKEEEIQRNAEIKKALKQIGFIRGDNANE